MRWLPWTLIAACAEPRDAGRAGVVLEWLQRDNAPWLSREPDLLEGKYRRMSKDPYDFLRGTSGLFHEDLRRPGAKRPASGLVASADAARVLLVGDPHPENLGTFYPNADPGPAGGTPPDLVLAWADHDAANYGPWTSDVLRAAQGVHLYALGWTGCEAACRDGAALTLIDGYADAIRTLTEGESTFRLEADLLGNPFIAGLRAEAWEEGAERKRLREFTEIVDGVRRFRLAETRGVDDEANLAPRGDEARLIERVSATWAKDRGVRVLAVARRYGQGVSSWPARRFLVLFDRGDDGPDDDQVANLREVLDPPAPLGGPTTTSPRWPHNAARLADAARATWPEPRPDPCFWTGVDGPASYKVLCYDSWYQGPGHDKGAELWQDGDADEADLATFARGVGFALAQAHARSRTTDGAPALDTIRADLPDGLLSIALGPAALAAAGQVETDHALFLGLLETEGPLLGADVWSP